MSNSGKLLVVGVAWAFSAAASYAGNFQPAMTSQKAETLINKLGSASQASVDGPWSPAAHAVSNHINGFARVGPYWIVNYTDTGRKTGRLLLWNSAAGAAYVTYDVDGLGGDDDYLAGMGGAADILAYTGRQPWVRFMRIAPNYKLTELPAYTATDGANFILVGLGVDHDRKKFVMLTKNGSGKVDVHEGTPGNWTLRTTLIGDFATWWNTGDEESRPLVYMGNGTFAAFVPKPGDDVFEFSYRILEVPAAGVVNYREPSTISLKHNEPAGAELDPFKGYASFRWAGDVQFNGTTLEMCASPRELNNAYNGNYSCWRATFAGK